MTYPSETTSLPLEYPVTINGTEYKELIVRRPKVRDRLIADKQQKDPMDKEVHLFSLLAGVEPAVIQDLDEVDYEALQGVYLGFRKGKSKSEPSSEG